MCSVSPVSHHSHASSIPIINGTNFSDWKEQVKFHLCVLDLDVALENEKPATLTDKSSEDEKALLKAWEKSNKLSIMFMQMTIANNIKTADKSLAGTLMAKLTTMKFDGRCGMHEHVIEMINLAA